MGVRSVPFGIVAIVLGFVLKSPGTQADPADIGLRAERPSISVFGTIHPDIFRFRAPIGSQPAVDRVRVASLDPQAGFDATADEQDTLGDEPVSAWRNASFDERFASLDDRPASFHERFASFDERSASFDERFGSATREPTRSVRLPPDRDLQKAAPPMGRLSEAPPTPTASERHVRPEQARRDPVPLSDRDLQKAAPPMGRLPEAPLTPTASERHVRPGQPRRDPVPLSDDGGRTAIYDIAAHVVYLPNGGRLEAHSGLGSIMDNPRHVHVRMRGATPPNVYNLSLRERLFHGVSAIRLTPVGSGKMYGRAGILAHSYMLGPNGQSNGCVSFRDYPEFLNAFLKGEVTRLVVVERLENPPGPKVASGWLDAIRNLFKPSDRVGQYAAADSH